jgi:hypothetical protein
MSTNALQKSLEALLEGGAQPATLLGGGTSAGAPAEALPDPEQLTTLELLYQFCKEVGDDVVGNPKSVFAAYAPGTETLQIFAADESSFKIVPYRTITMLEALDFVQEEQASFSVKASQVTCQIGAIQATGNSYPEAALRALVKHQQRLKSAK